MPDRERIYSVAVSSRLLAAVTYNAKCYIWALSSSADPCLVRLPSTMEGSIGVFQDNVVVSLYDIRSQKCTVVLIQCVLQGKEAVTATTREFSFDYPIGYQKGPDRRGANEVDLLQNFNWPQAFYRWPSSRWALSDNLWDRRHTLKYEAPYIVLDKTGAHIIVLQRTDRARDLGVYLRHYDRQGNIQFGAHIFPEESGSLVGSQLEVNESVDSKSERFFNIWSIAEPRREEVFGADNRDELLQIVYYPSQKKIRTRMQITINPGLMNANSWPTFLRKGILYSDLRPDKPLCKEELNDELVVLDVERGTKGYVER